MWIGHLWEIIKLMFRALALRQSEAWKLQLDNFSRMQLQLWSYQMEKETQNPE